MINSFSNQSLKNNICSNTAIVLGRVVFEARVRFLGPGDVTWPHWRFNCSSFLNYDIRPDHREQGPFWYGRVCVKLLAFLAAFEDRCRWNANYPWPWSWTRAQFKGWARPKPQSGRLSLFRSEALELPKATECLSGDTLSSPFITCVTHLECVGMTVCECGCVGGSSAYAFVSIVKWESLVLSGHLLEATFVPHDAADLKAALSPSHCLMPLKAMPQIIFQMFFSLMF